MKFEITNHGKNRKDTEAIDEVYASAAYGAGTEDEKEEYKEEEPAKVIDLNLIRTRPSQTRTHLLRLLSQRQTDRKLQEQKVIQKKMKPSL